MRKLQLSDLLMVPQLVSGTAKVSRPHIRLRMGLDPSQLSKHGLDTAHSLTSAPLLEDPREKS